MPAPPVRFDDLLATARAGDLSALGQLLSVYRDYLLSIAVADLDPNLRAKGGASDLVQDALLLACRHFGQFRGQREDEFLAWLRQTLLHEMADFRRRYRLTAKRNAVEVPLDERISAVVAPAGARELPSPGSDVVQREESRRLEEAMGRLPDDYREVLRLRYREQLSFAEIGERMTRSENAAQKVWASAIRRLRDELGETP